MKHLPYLTTIFLMLFTCALCSQATEKGMNESTVDTDFTDRQAIIETTKNFFIGDHTGSLKHMKLSMDAKGAYRYVNRDGEYSEYVFDLTQGEADTSYEEELLSIEIYGKLALVRLRMAELDGGAHYKLLTLHKTSDGWKITTITWGSGIIQ